jgi:carbon monoxide dehydrogenase subunit G
MPEILETTKSFRVQAPIEAVWAFVKDIRNWAPQMPGYERAEMLSDNNFSWVLTAEVGPLTRSVEIDVEVRRWGFPSEVQFDFVGRTEPFSGSGRYSAEALGDQTAISLEIKLKIGGTMAKVFMMLASPVFERCAREFVNNLKTAIEASTGPATLVTPLKNDPPSLVKNLAKYSSNVVSLIARCSK